jgi:hypothetical protein
MDVSRDGARIAILLSTASGPRLLVTAINRDSNLDQLPVGLSESILDVSTGPGTAIDATWVDDLSVAALTAQGAQWSVTQFEVGGEETSLGNPAGAIALVGGNGEAGLRALSDTGTVLSRSGNGWTDTSVVVSFVATQR